MLLEIRENQIILDKIPYIQDVRFNLDVRQQLFRLKLKYITSTDLEPVDLAMKYHIPKISVTSASISICFSGRELIRDISFHEEITFSLFNKTLHVKGNFGTKEINQKVDNIADILNIIKSEVSNYSH